MEDVAKVSKALGICPVSVCLLLKKDDVTLTADGLKPERNVGELELFDGTGLSDAEDVGRFCSTERQPR